MPDIKQIDKKILFYLDENARYPNTKLAKSVGLSASNVQYRISRLQKNGIISEFYLLLNPFAFKKRYDRLIVKFRSDWNTNEIKKYCKNTKKIGWHMLSDGDWNFGCQIWSDTTIETREVVDEFLSKFSKYIDKYDISSLISIDKFEHNFLFENLKSKNTTMQIVPEVKLDLLDKKIINLIFKDARMKLLDIANVLKVDYKVIAYRLKKLESNNVILGYKVQLGRFNLGYDYYKVKLTYSSYKKEDVEKLYNFLKSDKRVLFITKALGWSDLEFEIFCKDQNEYRNFKDKFRRKFARIIKDYEIMIPLEFNWNHIMP